MNFEYLLKDSDIDDAFNIYFKFNKTQERYRLICSDVYEKIMNTLEKEGITIPPRKVKEFNLIFHRFTMNIGNILQYLAGCRKGMIDTGHVKGHSKGAPDISNETHTYAETIKASVDTCNSGSKATEYNNLIKYKDKYPKAKLIFSVFNTCTKSNKGIKVYKQVGKYKVLYITGKEALSFDFGEKYEDIIKKIEDKSYKLLMKKIRNILK
jgi:hypothetical protein